ncbi:MAG: hypothetical protein H6867_10780 [Rhodospirillales bacterium]|nr:hypothetical protein [Rhodospirillales bacterium]MCB9995734.1 hypothetical protein [Rhodospirillales bacterium]
MAHKALCDRFGLHTTLAVGFLLPVGLTTAFALATGSDIKDALFAGSLAGFAGWNVGATTESFAELRAKKRNLGVTKGSQYVQKSQIIAYFLAATCTVGGYYALYADKASPTPMNSSTKTGLLTTKARQVTLDFLPVPGVS